MTHPVAHTISNLNHLDQQSPDQAIYNNKVLQTNLTAPPPLSENSKHSAILPIAISIIVGYFVADLFFAVYEMAVDTILLSFCEDCEMNGGNPKYAPPLLAATMNKIPLVAPPTAPIKA